MTAPDDASRREPPRHGDDLERRERELERFRANIERLRRERQAALDEFSALTRRRDEASSGSSGSTTSPAVGEPAPPEPEVLARTGMAMGPALPVEEVDRFVPPEPVGPSGDGDAVDLPDDEAAASPLPDEELDFAALTEEDTIIDSAPRRAADRRRTVIFSLVGAGAVGMLAWWLWGPWSQRRTEAPLVASSPAGEQGPSPVAEPEPTQPAGVEPASLAEPAGVAPEGVAEAGAGGSPAPALARPLVVRLVAARPVWIRAIVDGETSLNRRVEAGEAVTLEAGETVSVRVGDAGAVRVSVNGRDRGPAGRDGQVRTLTFATAEP